MRKQIVKITGVIMMLVFLAAIAPKEFLHDLFFDHHDTEEPILAKNDVVIGQKHAHCSFLSFEFAPFVPSEPQRIVFEDVLEHKTAYVLPFYHCYYSQSSSVASLRGPPTAVLS